LRLLDVGYIQVYDLEPLKGLLKLENIGLYGTGISDLEPIEGLKNLKGLIIGNTQVSDLEPLKNLTKLTQLDIRGCKNITD
jgi:internalin A